MFILKYKIIKHGNNYINPVICPECMSDTVISDKNELYHWYGPFKISCDCDEYTCKNCGCEFVALNKKKIKDIETSKLSGWIALITIVFAVLFFILSIAIYNEEFNLFDILAIINFIVCIICLIIWLADV